MMELLHNHSNKLNFINCIYVTTMFAKDLYCANICYAASMGKLIKPKKVVQIGILKFHSAYQNSRCSKRKKFVMFLRETFCGRQQ